MIVGADGPPGSTPLPVPEIRTERLLLRGWRPDDIEMIVAIFGDERTARHVGGVKVPWQAWRHMATILAPPANDRLSIAQGLGFSLADIKQQLDGLPDRRTPTARDWETLSTRFAADIDRRIEGLRQLRGTLAQCIGCGCLSLSHCRLYNPGDEAATLGDGPRYLLGDSAADIDTDRQR